MAAAVRKLIFSSGFITVELPLACISEISNDGGLPPGGLLRRVPVSISQKQDTAQLEM